MFVNIQTFITTHSSHIANAIDFSKVRYAKKNGDKVIYKDLQVFALSNPRNIDFIRQYLTISRCDLFFADKAILIEGTSERLLLPDMIKKLEEVNSLMNFKEIIPISVKNSDNVELLLKKVYEYLPEGPMYYPEDQITDVPERFIVSELIREKVLFLTNEEVPHSVAVTDVLYKDNNTIFATIIVERESQKKIIIGHNGEMIKKIGHLARLDINKLLNKKINLELWVKVKENWRNKLVDVKSYGNYND